MIGYLNKVQEAMGFFPFRMQLEVLTAMEVASFAILFLGLVFDLVVVLFIALSVILIYSLLLISVESKTFEFGVMRMVGLNQSGLMHMILLQSFMFVIPSVICGFAASVPLLAVILPFLFNEDPEIDQSPLPSSFATQQALAVGLIIPIVSSIIPIQAALSKDLNSSLDINKAKQQAENIEIHSASDSGRNGYFAVGLIAFGYSFCIYYMMPLAMLSLDFSTMLRIFLFILVGLLCGLSLLAFNLQSLLENIFTRFFLCWESASMRILVLKNLDSHRSRNKMTSIIYSISLGFIIFLVVSSTLVLASTQSQSLQEEGAYLQFRANMANMISPRLFDKVLKDHEDIIEDFGFITPRLTNLERANAVKVEITDVSRIKSEEVEVYGVSPSLIDASVSDYMLLTDNQSKLSPSEQLYTAAGTQSIGLGKLISDITSAQASGMAIIKVFSSNIEVRTNKMYLKRPKWIARQAPAFRMRDRSDLLGGGK